VSPSRRRREGSGPIRRLVAVCGDQLNRDSAAFDGFDPAADAVWMAELTEEAAYVRSHQLRLVQFFSAMRHFRDALRGEGMRVEYRALGAKASNGDGTSFRETLERDLNRLRPEEAVVARPGDWRVLAQIRGAAEAAGSAIRVEPDRWALCGIDEFADYAEGKKDLVMEFFYRRLRKRDGVLLDGGGAPEGGAWNLDKANREAFDGEPRDVPPMPVFPPDETTRSVVEMVRARFGKHPGDARTWTMPVTPGEAEQLLGDFIERRLPRFGRYEDAMWTGQPFLYHSRLSAALNLHLLHPRRCLDAAVAAYRDGRAPIQSVEGFVRQILGWREFIRGVYWLKMPDYAGSNALGCDRDLPSFYWDGETEMACARDAMRSVLDHGYAHHIQRLMVLGLYSLLAGCHPLRFHEWHMAMLLDAVDWVSLPNAVGMSQYGDGGIVGTKPYCATGRYIDRMSNACAACRYRPDVETGDEACPFTMLYWDFLARNEERFRANRRMAFQVKNLARKRDAGRLDAIREECRRRWPD
jgi:deoxyribodipyrimidine photolyase-related protein